MSCERMISVHDRDFIIEPNDTKEAHFRRLSGTPEDLASNH